MSTVSANMLQTDRAKGYQNEMDEERNKKKKKRNQEVSLVLGYSQCLEEGRVGVWCEAGLSRGLGDCGQLFPDKECQGPEGTLSLHLHPLPMGQGAPA